MVSVFNIIIRILINDIILIIEYKRKSYSSSKYFLIIIYLNSRIQCCFMKSRNNRIRTEFNGFNRDIGFGSFYKVGSATVWTSLIHNLLDVFYHLYLCHSVYWGLSNMRIRNFSNNSHHLVCQKLAFDDVTILWNILFLLK